jgi:hypothetical protein
MNYITMNYIHIDFLLIDTNQVFFNIGIYLTLRKNGEEQLELKSKFRLMCGVV